MEDRPIYKDETRQLYLSYWYEELMRHLLHVPSIPLDEWFRTKADECFDLEDRLLRAKVDAKASSNMDQTKLFADQLDAQLKELGFPIEDGIILIFSYINREQRRRGKQQKRLLKRGSGKSLKTLSQFCAIHTNVVYAVHLGLIKLFREKNGMQSYRRDLLNIRSSIKVGRRELKSLAENARVGLEALGVTADDLPRWLPPRAHRIRSRTVKTVFDGNDMSFQLVPLLPNSLKIRFLRRLNGTVQKIDT